MNKNLLGSALWDFYKSPGEQELITWTHLTEEDPILISYFFRTHDEMPAIEQKALALAQGKVLDIGCGAGSHSLYLQNDLQLHVTAADIDPSAVATATARGVLNTVCIDIYDHEEKYDTLLLLMNGIGMCENLMGLKELLIHFKGLLNLGGQILMDSSDLIYLFSQREDSQCILWEVITVRLISEFGIWEKNKFFNGSISILKRFSGLHLRLDIIVN